MCPFGRTLGSSSNGPLWKYSLRYKNLYWHGKWQIVWQSGTWKEQICKFGDKRSKKEVCGLSGWVHSGKAVVFYVNAPQKRWLTNVETRWLVPWMSISFPNHLVFAQWIHGKSSHGSKDAVCGLNINFPSPRIIWLELPLNAQATNGRSQNKTPQYNTIPMEICQLLDGKLITLDLFTLWRREWFILMRTHTITDSDLSP